jgi:predicted negative regulator of RcsB-dependent stress response
VIQDHLGDLLSKLGRHEEAIEAWEAALDGDGEQVESSDIERKIADARRQLGRE